MSTIRAVMQPNPSTVGPDYSIQAAVGLLIKNHFSGLPVVSGDNSILGILSEKDVLKAFYETDCTTVGSLMTRDPTTFSVDAPLVDVVDCLMTYDFRRVLIHDAGKLVGLVSRADLMPVVMMALLDHIGESAE
jgi:CBS domain-containing protein